MTTSDNIFELIRPGAFGDLIMLTALFPTLKAQGYKIRVVCWPFYGSVLQDHPDVDEFVFFQEGQSLYVEDIKRYIASVTGPAAQSAVLDYPNWQWPGILPHALQQHATEFFAAQANITPSDELSLYLSEEQLAWGEQYKDVILIQTKTSYSPYKNWPLDRWEELVRLIQSELGERVFQIGAWDDPKVPGVEPIESPSIRHAIAALKQCKLFIGLDSVFNHASRAVKKKSIILWGSTNPATFGYAQNINLVNGVSWQPVMGNEAPLLRCQPCYREYKHIHNFPKLLCPYTVPYRQVALPEHDANEPQLHACMASNTVPIVFHQVKTMLNQP